MAGVLCSYLGCCILSVYSRACFETHCHAIAAHLHLLFYTKMLVNTRCSGYCCMDARRQYLGVLPALFMQNDRQICTTLSRQAASKHALGHPIEISNENEACALGTAIIAATGASEYASLQDAVCVMAADTRRVPWSIGSDLPVS